MINNVYPIQFSIPDVKIVKTIPVKDRSFATIIPGDFKTYIYDSEIDYYKDYQRSYYGITCRKGGWDCMRHYEILANGCIPYFIDLKKCPSKTMAFFPKELILEGMSIEGIAYPEIDFDRFDPSKYHKILTELLDYTRKLLTTKQIAEYLLTTIQYSQNGKILYLSGDLWPDYLRCLTLIGLKEILSERIIDFPKIAHIYKSYSEPIQPLCGKGFSYTKILDDIPIDRENIKEKICKKEFDLIIYGNLHRGLPFYNEVVSHYEPERIIYLCGLDAHRCVPGLTNLFLRESDALNNC